jgi:ribosomal protein S18 acetylase RimI-like enzyme
MNPARVSRIAPDPPFEPVKIRLARPNDAGALAQLESVAFLTDKISRRSWTHLIASASSEITVVVDSSDDQLQGSLVILYRRGSAVARVYSLAVAQRFRNRGVAGLLLRDAVEKARRHGSAVLRLETRVDNVKAQSLFSRIGFVEFGRTPRYYQDGVEAVRYQQYLSDEGHAGNALALRSPFYGQTLEFTCGPCALMMAMAALDPSFVPDRTTEIRL